MKREFLEGLEVNGVKLSKELVDQIMTENGKDIQREQAKVATAQQTITDLQEKVKQFDGVDVQKLQNDIKEWEKKYNGTLLENAINQKLAESKAKNQKAVRALLDMSILKLDGDKVLGLNEQLETIKKENDFLFGDVQQPKNTGMSHQGGTEGGGQDKKEEANAAIRAVFGKGNEK